MKLPLTSVKPSLRPTLRLALASLVFAATAPAASAAEEGRPIEVHGHRGARAVFPENSLSAFRFALETGVDFIELDVRISRDGEVMVIHDPEVNPEHCLDGDGKPVPSGMGIHHLTADELSRFDCGSLPHPDFPRQKRVPGSRIPTLRQVLELLRDSPLPAAKRVGLHIELKARPRDATPPPEEFARKVIDLLREFGMLDRTLLQSFDFRYTRAAEKLARTFGRKESARVISPEHTWLRGVRGRMLFRLLKAMGFKVVPWTANTIEDWRYLIGLGVDGIITDDPAALIQYLKTP